MLLGGLLLEVVVVVVRLGCSFSDVWRGGLRVLVFYCCCRILMMSLRFLVLILTRIRIRTLVVLLRESSEKNRFLGDVVSVD